MTACPIAQNRRSAAIDVRDAMQAGICRVVIPKPAREALGLAGGEELEISVRDDGRLELEVPATPMRLARRAHGVVAVADRELPTLTQKAVRETLERVRR